MTFIGDGAIRHTDMLRREVGVRALDLPPPHSPAPIGQIAAGGPCERRAAACNRADLRAQVGCGTRPRAPQRHAMSPWTTAEYLDQHVCGKTTISTEVVALEAASFTNPWSREMLARDLRNTDVVARVLLRETPGQLLGFAAAGSSPTNCTSTRWR